MSSSSKTPSLAGAQPKTPAFRAAGVAGAIGAAVAVWLLARFGSGVTLRQPAFSATEHPAHLAIGFVIVAATVASLAGWSAASWIGRSAQRPRATWVIIATAATVISLTMPFSGHGITDAQRLALACLHLAVAAVLIPVLAATLPSHRRPGRFHPGRSSAGDIAQPAAPSPR